MNPSMDEKAVSKKTSFADWGEEKRSKDEETPVGTRNNAKLMLKEAVTVVLLVSIFLPFALKLIPFNKTPLLESSVESESLNNARSMLQDAKSNVDRAASEGRQFVDRAKSEGKDMADRAKSSGKDVLEGGKDLADRAKSKTSDVARPGINSVKRKVIKHELHQLRREVLFKLQQLLLLPIKALYVVLKLVTMPVVFVKERLHGLIRRWDHRAVA